MGDSEIRFSYGPAGVFWNLKDYPITSPDLLSIFDNSSSALDEMKCSSYRHVLMFGANPDDIKPDPQVIGLMEIFYEPHRGPEDTIVREYNKEVGENAADWLMARMIIARAMGAVEPFNIVVLAKNKPESEVFRVLRSLKPHRQFNIFLLELPEDSTAKELFSSVDTILNCTKRF